MILVPKGSQNQAGRGLLIWCMTASLPYMWMHAPKLRDQRGLMVGPILWAGVIRLTARMTRAGGLTIIMTKSTPESDDQRVGMLTLKPLDSV
jgi:hypothetical protein